LFRETRIRVSHRDDSIEEKCFVQLRALSKLPKKNKSVEGDDQEIHDRKVL
jgi:hypothetical protein